MEANAGSSFDALQTFLDARGLREADGRPLYAYRCDSREFAAFQELLQGRLKRRGWNQSTAQLFCLLGAEWWRRNHSGGAWKWEGILDSIGAESFSPGAQNYSELLRIVQRGLEGWNRDLLTVGQARAFLVTLACEGGLPLRLVMNEQTKLRSYFRALLEEFRLFGHSEIPGRELAERVGDRLPKGLRQDVVYELTARLAERVLALQQLVGESDYPVEELDAHHAGWRDQLPLRLPDRIARTLLNNLLRDAADVARGGRLKIRWQRSLVPLRDEEWDLVGEFTLPRTITSADFNRLFRRTEDDAPPKRFDLCDRVEGGGLHVIAIGSQRDMGGDRTVIAVEVPVGRSEGSLSAGSEQRRQLVARTSGSLLQTDAFPGAAALSDLPWVFVSDDPQARDPARFVGEGSLRLREGGGLVAVPNGTQVQAADESTVEPVGTLPRLSRSVYRVTGVATFVAPDDTRVVVRTGADKDDSQLEYRPTGRRARFGRESTPYFCGPPRLLAWKDGVFQHEVPQAALSWEPDGFQDTLPFGSGVVGDGRLRFVEDGEARFSARVRILPEGASIRFSPADCETEGNILLDGFLTDAISLVSPTNLQWEEQKAGSEARGVCLRAPGEPPTDVAIALRWQGRGQTLLSLPFPSARTAFVLPDGPRLSDGERISAEALAGIHAEAVVPKSHVEFTISGEYRGADLLDLAAGRRQFRWPLREVSDGFHSVDLAEIQGRVGELLSQGVDPDACVRIRINSNASIAGMPVCTVNIHRFDLTLEKRERYPVVLGLDEESLRRILPHEIEDLELEAVSLLSPEKDGTPLSRYGAGAWHLPDEEMTVGPYVVVGRQKDWYRVRPMPWYVRRDGDGFLPRMDAPPTLAQLYQSGLADDADGRFRSVLRAMAVDSAHEDWGAFDGLVRLSALLPVRTFQLLTSVAHEPAAVAHAALRVGATDFDLLWDKLALLPFLWELVPIDAWAGAIKTRVSGLRSMMAEMPEAIASDLVQESVEAAAGRVSKRLPGVAPAIESALAQALHRPPGNGATKIVLPHLREVLKEQWLDHRGDCPSLSWAPHQVPRVHRAEAIHETLSNDDCASGLLVPRIGRFSDPDKASYADFPVFSAAHVVWGDLLNSRQQREIRAARAHDPDWFDEALRLTTLLIYGCQKHKGIEKHLHG